MPNENNEMDVQPRAVQLDSRSTGECPCGCGERAYPYAIPGDEEGYFDASAACADDMLLSFL